MHAALSIALQGQRIATPGARTPAPQTAQPTPGAPHPIGPSSSPLRPFGLVCGCALACARTSWRSQAPARGCLRKDRAKPRLQLRYADPTQCALGALLPLFSRADRAHTRLSPLALWQGAPHSEACHHLRCAGVQEPGPRKRALFAEADEAIIVPPT